MARRETQSKPKKFYHLLSQGQLSWKEVLFTVLAIEGKGGVWRRKKADAGKRHGEVIGL